MDPGPDILYRPYRDEDRPGVIDILYRTGFMGEDLTGTDRFNDRVLFALVNMDGYLRYEKENVCVAQARDTGKVLGYIMGTADTLSYQKTFRRRMYGRIALRVVLVSSWRYPESFQALLHWGWTFSMDHERPFYADYPGHMHINCLPGHQRRGIGGNLIRMFQDGMRAKGVGGIHLGTSNFNHKALPFYRARGFTLLAEKQQSFWPGVPGQVSMTFGKRLA